MIQYICDICNQPQQSVYEIQIKNTADDTPAVTKHICNGCYQKFQTPSETTTTPDETLEEEKTPKFYDYTSEYQGMTLREFLSSPFYLHSNHQFMFRTTDNKIIQDYEFWMPRQIITVHPPTSAHKEIIVTLR